jgi:hypothetical protein
MARLFSSAAAVLASLIVLFVGVGVPRREQQQSRRGG